jgi:hypothetical protein
MSVRHSEYKRARGDYYCEPTWAVSPILDCLAPAELHDPCCGRGTIVTAAQQRGVSATGADIADRARGQFAVRDFLADTAIYSNVICNPPYKMAARIVEHALAHVVNDGRVAVLVPIAFLASQRRFLLFSRPETELVIVMSRRPSMPPGELLEALGEGIRGRGSSDFCWIAWRRGRTDGLARIVWALPS